ncbi:tetratricopeptide repeat protein [Phormidesmis sp. 146-12]
MQHVRQRLRFTTVVTNLCTYSFWVTAILWGVAKSGLTEPAKEFEFKDFNFWADQCRSLSLEKLYPEALQSCEKAISLNPEKDRKKQQQATLDLWKLRSDALLNLGQYQDAIGSYDYVLGIQPAYSSGLTQRCDALARLGRYESAIASCDQALRVDGEWGELNPAVAWSSRGKTLRKMGQLEDAIAAYDQVLSITPTNYTIQAERCETILVFKKTQTTTLSQTADPKLQEALERTQEEEKTCTNALTISIQQAETDKLQLSPLFRYKQGLIARQQGRFPDAKAAFEKAVVGYENALANNPNDPLLWTYQGMVLEQLGQDARALTSYERAIQLRPNSTIALVNQCAVLNRLRQPQAALTACDNALKGDGLWEESNSAYAWSQRSSALLGLQRYEDAVASADRAIALSITDAETLNYKAIGLWYLSSTESPSRLQQAQEDLEKIAQNSQYPQALLTLARIYSTQNNREEAAKHYQKALEAYDAAIKTELKADDPLFYADLLTNYAVALWHLGRKGEALSKAKEAATWNPRSFEVHFNYGTIALSLALRLEDYSKALAAFQKANQIQPNNVLVMTGLGTSLFKLDRKQEAIAALKAALAINPTSEPARTTLKKLITQQISQPTNGSTEKGK